MLAPVPLPLLSPLLLWLEDPLRFMLDFDFWLCVLLPLWLLFVVETSLTVPLRLPVWSIQSFRRDVLELLPELLDFATDLCLLTPRDRSTLVRALSPLLDPVSLLSWYVLCHPAWPEPALPLLLETDLLILRCRA